MSKGARSTVVDQTVERIRSAVRQGRYLPGQRLVEVDLTEELGVSRGPLREALSRLSADGLVQIEPYRGATVRRLTRSDVVELFEVRAALEAEAAGLAAERVDQDDHRARVEAVLEEIARLRGSDDPQEYFDDNTRFHNIIVDIAGNSLLATMTGQLHTHAYRMQFMQLLTPETRAVSLDDHEAIAEAIGAGDANRARRAMRDHVNRSLAATLALPDAGFG